MIDDSGERTVIAHYDPEGAYANRLRSQQELVDYVKQNWSALWREAVEFEKRWPRTGDEALDAYARCYAMAGVALTKLFRNGDVVSMGYSELNQRDSFWAGWVHLAFWPELERKMIEESAAHQLDDGRIPTTILPLIDRKDDIDISEYFVLRVFRYFDHTGDRDFLESMRPALRRAVDYLKSRDRDGDFVPEQESIWADWKDVPGVEGRLHSPHFALLWLAVLDRMRDPWFEAASKTVHDKLWNGRCYVNQWRDGREDSTVAEEQVVGAFFNVIPRDRIPKIFEALRANETPWGVRESFPYRKDFGYEPGDYHNGGIWPFLNAVDAWARIRCGFREDGIRLLKKIGHADLEAEGDWFPHENVHGETGKNIRHRVQAWNAAYFGAVHFGLGNRSSPEGSR
jgi:glycogen debranching enzyme